MTDRLPPLQRLPTGARWSPADEFRDAKPARLPIVEPPCKGCRYFVPVATFEDGAHFAGVRLCHAKEMHPDFSCFREPL